MKIINMHQIQNIVYKSEPLLNVFCLNSNTIQIINAYVMLFFLIKQYIWILDIYYNKQEE